MQTAPGAAKVGLERASDRPTERTNATRTGEEGTREGRRAPQMIIVREAYNKTIFHRRRARGAVAETLLIAKNFVYPSLLVSRDFSIIHSSNK